MKMTLLQMVQNILSAMNSDEVNSIGDTTEARQVAEAIRTTYYNIIARADLPEQIGLFSLTPSNDPDSPVLMYKPQDLINIEWIKYNKSEAVNQIANPDYSYVRILPNAEFLEMINRLDINEPNVNAYTLNNRVYFYKDDQHPTYCTIISDTVLLFDSFRQDLDDTLQEHKTLVKGRMLPSFSIENSFVPKLDPQQFPLLLNEAKSLCFLEMRQIGHNKAEQESRRQWRTLQRTKSLYQTPTDFEKLPNFGRYGRGGFDLGRKLFPWI